jgi:dienelactone hydrolase
MELEIAVGGHKAEAFLYRNGEMRRSGVLLYTDIKGIRDVYHMPAESIAKLDVALRAWHGKFASRTYDGAHHGWTNADASVYNSVQAEKAFADLLALFRGSLH